MMPRPATGRMTPERQRLRDRANMLCDQRAASSVRASRTVSSQCCVFPRHPAASGRRFCRGCKRWLTSRFWTSAKGNEDCRCDDCMRVSWRGYNEAARARPSSVAMMMPKGWGF
jgi:hypothetical protein